MKMNRNILNIGIAALLSGGLMASCSSDYLATEPETSVSSSAIVATTEAAQMALDGIAKSMNCQYGSTSYNQYSGEGFINTVFNDQFGPDYIGGLWQQSWSAQMNRWETFENERWTGLNYPWGYCYNLISQANNILAGIDNAEGDEGDRQFMKAQALTYRAHGYVKLLMLFAPRWEDSNNGEKYCLPLRLEPGIGDIPLSTMNAVLKAIYDDLDEAIELYAESGRSRSKSWEPDIDVARGIYARAALIKHDWPKAQTMAHDARQAYPIMSAQEYLNGFSYENGETMWCQDAEPSDTYFWAWGVNYSCNGNHIETWGIGGGSINIDLYRQLDPNDIRALLYFTPDKIDYLDPAEDNPANCTEADFWNPNYVDDSNILDCSIGTKLNSQGLPVSWGLRPVCMGWIFTAMSLNQKMSPEAKLPYLTYNYATAYPASQHGLLWALNSAGSILGGPAVMPFGSEFKFYAIDAYGTMQYPFMRGAEMCLAEAEAAYMADDETTAKACLLELNSKRIPGYSCNKTGADLLEEIRLTRRIELWGEGQNFSDFKRWNIPAEKRAWKANDPTSGNCIEDCAYSHDTSFANGWRMTIPSDETDFNKLIDRTLLK